MRKLIGPLVIILLVSVVVAKLDILPQIGDPASPANTHISTKYIEYSMENHYSHNLVTAVLADYRGFDTLFEVTVLFLAGLSVVVALSDQKKKTPPISPGNNISFGGVVIGSSFRILIPVILIYAVYVLIHGEVSLGGGFQAGALIAIAYMLDRIIPTDGEYLFRFTEAGALCIAGVGAFIYVMVGILAMVGDGNFLEYVALPFPLMGADKLHSTGVLLIEVGVTVCVASTIIDILEAILERTEFND